MGLPQEVNNYEDEAAIQEDIVKRLLKEVYKMGLIDGYHHGYADGVEDSKKNLGPAVSGGLRKGSPECSAALRDF